MAMDLEETEARNDCAGKGQQQSNQPTKKKQLVAVESYSWLGGHELVATSQPPPKENVSMEAEEYPLLGAVT
jgi:hypothetical protein